MVRKQCDGLLEHVVISRRFFGDWREESPAETYPRQVLLVSGAMPDC